MDTFQKSSGNTNQSQNNKQWGRLQDLGAAVKLTKSGQGKSAEGSRGHQ